MPSAALGFPAKYRQGAGALFELGAEASLLGDKPFVIADDFVWSLTSDQVCVSMADAGKEFRYEEFRGECCRPEIDRLVNASAEVEADVLVAIGGGKVLDTGKAVTAEAGIPLISVPTIASTDGPVSSIAVEYTEDHIHIGVMRFNQSPAVVLVDSNVIANAPARLLVAGMGDGLATWIEARACQRKGVTNFRGGAISNVAMTLARSCHETILEHGERALKDLETGAVTDAVEQIIEANIFLSGVGFENTGVAAAHALDTAVSRFSSDHSIQHGERVALGVLFQLLLEENEADLEELTVFYQTVGLPDCLDKIGLGSLSESELSDLAEIVLRSGSPIRNLPFNVSHDQVVDALMKLR